MWILWCIFSLVIWAPCIFFFVTSMYSPFFFFKQETSFAVCFRNAGILTPVSQNSEWLFFFSRQRCRFLVLLSGDANSTENCLLVDLQLGLLMGPGSSARKPSWTGGSGVSRRGVMCLEMGPKVWLYHGKCIIEGGSKAWKLGQYKKKSLENSWKTNKVEVIGL